MKSFFDSIESKDEVEAEEKIEAALNDFLKNVDMRRYWSYDGSFTTPPCTEGIKWSVVTEVQSISSEQLKKLTTRLADDQDFAEGNGNNRVVQAYHERTVYYTGDVQEDTAASLVLSAVASLATIAAITF